MKRKAKSLQREKRFSHGHSVPGEVKHLKPDSMTFFTVTLSLIYIAAALFIPSVEKALHISSIILLMLVISWADIREKQIPLSCLYGAFVINAVHSLFFYGNLITWVVGLLFALLLMVIRLIKRDAIGTGDILLLGVLIAILPMENILTFLFLSFFCSSIIGTILVLIKKGSESVVIPMAPCITLAFIAGILIKWH